MLVSIVAVSSSSIHSVFTPTHCDPCDWATSLCCCCLGFHQRIQVPLCWRTFQSSLEDEPPYLTEFKRNSASDKTQGCFSRTGHWDAVVRPFSETVDMYSVGCTSKSHYNPHRLSTLSHTKKVVGLSVKKYWLLEYFVQSCIILGEKIGCFSFRDCESDVSRPIVPHTTSPIVSSRMRTNIRRKNGRLVVFVKAPIASGLKVRLAGA